MRETKVNDQELSWLSSADTCTRTYLRQVQALVLQDISDKGKGRVAIAGTSFPAALLCENDGCVLRKGTMVKVLGRKGLTLLVSPD